jgi:hypothetical protein
MASARRNTLAVFLAVIVLATRVSRAETIWLSIYAISIIWIFQNEDLGREVRNQKLNSRCVEEFDQRVNQVK